jgi:FkbM family methyltransferase
MRIIYVTPHLSTGGMPEYLRRKVELMIEENDVWVVEKHFEPAYRSIRDKIENLIGDRLISIGENQSKLLELINEVEPDVVHFEELSDYHFAEPLLELIYTKDRKYKIFDTLHDSSIDDREKRFIPDKMIVVSPWQIKNFLGLNIPIEIIEHEIIPGERDRSGLLKLGLDPNKKHIVQVGLFSRRKNQSETFQLARLMPDVMFHFIGNQTDNYSDYWKPLIDNKPNNCIIWGERSDADTFYSCMDAVIFPSKGDYGDRETNPLVIRESIAWKIPLFLRDLPFYMDMYRESEMVKFMSDDLVESSNMLYQIIKKEKKELNMETELNNEFFKRKLFNISFDSNDNKINFEYLEFTRLDLKVCVRDIDTEVPIYSFDAVFENKSSLWCMPIPKQYYDFQNNPNFGGFLYDFYKDGKRVYTMTTRIKPSLINKERFRIDSFEPLFINYEQFFTDKIYENFFDQIPTLESVIDIGANVGLFTELALRKGANEVKAVEINNVAIDVFKKTHGEKENVKLITEAISKEKGEIDIFINSENSLISSVDSSPNMIKDTVKSIGLNDLIKEKVDLVKIDVEGAEYEIFEGASGKTLKNVKFFLIEFHNNFGGILRDDILKKLEDNGFEYTLYQDNCVSKASEWEENGTIFAKIKN